MKCDNSLSVVPLHTPQASWVDGVKTMICEECGQRVKIYSDGLRYRLAVHNHLPIPTEPLLCDNEWIAEVMWDVD